MSDGPEFAIVRNDGTALVGLAAKFSTHVAGGEAVARFTSRAEAQAILNHLNEDGAAITQVSPEWVADKIFGGSNGR